MAKRSVGGRALLCAFCILLGAGCSTVQARAVATGPHPPGPRQGTVAVYMVDPPPGVGQAGGPREVGIVEVRAYGDEGNVEILLPAFLDKVAGLGGNVAFVESVRARFEVVRSPRMESYVYPCGFSYCTGTRAWSTLDEVTSVVMSGRAYFNDAAASVSAPSTAPRPAGTSTP